MKVAGAYPGLLRGEGRFAVPGWIADYDWDGTIPSDLLPSISDPKDGLVVTANDDWSVAGRRLPYPGVYAESDRAMRARQLGSALRAATVADMRAMQSDLYSPYAARVVSALGSVRFADPLAAKAVSVLAGWDKHADTRGPSRLFFAFMKEIRKAVGGGGARITWSMLDRMIEGHAAQGVWDDPATPELETRAARLERALARACETVEREDGGDPARWTLGKVHQL